VKIHKIKKKAQCRIHILGMRKGEEKEKPNNSTQLGQDTVAGEAQAHQRTDQAKVVARWAHLGGGTTKVWPHPIASTWPHSLVAVVWWCVKAVSSGFPFYQRQTIIHTL
jgi:hypothetical protein